MSENPMSRQHMWKIALNAAHDVALSKIQGTLEISKNYSVELALNQGLYALGVLSVEDFEIFDKRYRTKYVDVVAANREKRENSHIPKLEIEKQKIADRIGKLASPHQTIPIDAKEKLNQTFKLIYESWNERTSEADLLWRTKNLSYAKRNSNLEWAKKLIDKVEGESAI